MRAVCLTFIKHTHRGGVWYRGCVCIAPWLPVTPTCHLVATGINSAAQERSSSYLLPACEKSHLSSRMSGKTFMQSTILIFLFPSMVLSVNCLCRWVEIYSQDISIASLTSFYLSVSLSLFLGHGAQMPVQSLLPPGTMLANVFQVEIWVQRVPSRDQRSQEV